MVDILIPISDIYDNIDYTLFSLCMQSVKDKIKVYVVGNCICHNALNIINSFKDYLNIEILENDNLFNLGMKLQYGIDNSFNKYFMFVNCGDVLFDYNSLCYILNSIKDSDLCVTTMIKEDNGICKEIVNTHNNIFAKLYKRSYIDKIKLRFNESNIFEGISFYRLLLLTDPKMNEYNYCTYYSSVDYKDEVETFHDIELYIFNIMWAIDNGIDMKCNSMYIAETVCSAMYRVFFWYLAYEDIIDNDKYFKMVKKLIERYKQFSDVLNDGDKFRYYYMHSKQFFTKIPKISLNTFIKMVEEVL